MLERKKILLLLLLGIPASVVPSDNNHDNKKGSAQESNFNTKRLDAIISPEDGTSFEQNYDKILKYISSNDYLDQLSSSENSGYFNDTKPHHFDLSELPILIEHIKTKIRSGKYSFLEIFKPLVAVPCEKLSNKSQNNMVNNFNKIITELPIQSLDANINQKVIIPSILTALRSPSDTNMPLLSQNICNMPEVKEKIGKNKKLEELIKQFRIEQLFPKNAINNSLYFKKTINITPDEAEQLENKLILINTKINETYTNLKKGSEYLKHLPIDLNAFYKFISVPDGLAKIKGPLKDDVEYLIPERMKNQIILTSALKKLLRSIQEKLNTTSDGAAFPSTIQSMNDFLATHGKTLSEEEKNSVYNATAYYIFSTGVNQQKSYLPGTKFYNEKMATLIITLDEITLKEKLEYIFDHLFTTKKITFGPKLTTNNFATNFNNFFMKNKLYDNFLDIIEQIKFLSIFSSKFFTDQKDNFALTNNLLLSEKILMLSNNGLTKKDLDSVDAKTATLQSIYTTLYLNKNKDAFSSALATGLLTTLKPIVGNLMPYNINITSSTAENQNPILQAKNIYNIQTQERTEGKFNLIGNQLFYGPPGSGKSSFVNTLTISCQTGAFLGANKTFIDLTTDCEKLPTFIYEKNKGELRNEKKQTGLSNYQTNIRTIINLGMFLEQMKEEKIITIFDETFSAGNQNTVAHFIEESPAFKEIIKSATGIYVIEHNIETLNKFRKGQLNILGQKIISDGKTVLAKKDLAPFEKSITQQEKECLKKHKEDPRFYFMFNIQTNEIIEISAAYYNEHKTSSDNQFFSLTTDISKIQYTDPDPRNPQSDIKLLCYPEFHLITGTKNENNTKFVLWTRIEPIFEKETDGKIKSVRFQLVKKTENDSIPFFNTDTSSIVTEGIHGLTTQRNSTLAGKNETMTCFVSPVLQEILNRYIGKATTYAVDVYNKRITDPEIKVN